MASRRHDIGSLTALFAFEAAGRSGSFTMAAKELGVTQAAVSKQVAGLEAALGVKLFTRLHRRVRLTEAGAELFDVVSAALTAVGGSMKKLREGARARGVTIAATMTMSHFWLLPLLPSLRRSHPELIIRILSQDEPVDLRSDPADLAIRFGDGSWRDGRVTPLFPGEIYAMASPGLVAEIGRASEASDVLKYPLIAYDAPDPSWADWDDWLAAAGIGGRAPAPTLSFTRYSDAIQAAQDGQGGVLVWGGLSGGIEERGALVRLPGPAIRPTGDFYLVRSWRNGADAACEVVAEYLIEKAVDRIDGRRWRPGTGVPPQAR